MEQVIDEVAPPVVTNRSHVLALLILLLHSVVFALPILFKFLGVPFAATWSWWQVTAVVWVPWSILIVVSGFGWLILKIQNSGYLARPPKPRS